SSPSPVSRPRSPAFCAPCAPARSTPWPRRKRSPSPCSTSRKRPTAPRARYRPEADRQKADTSMHNELTDPINNHRPESATERQYGPLTCDGLLFDMDGTVLTSIAAAERVWSKWARRHGLDVDAFLRTIHGKRAI